MELSCPKQYNQSNRAIDAKANYWGTANAALIPSKIFDYNDDLSKGAVDFTGHRASLNTAAPISPAHMCGR